MSVIVPPTPEAKSRKLPYVFAAVLCLCTLVALWVTAARVKAAKMAARYGERILEEAPVVGEKPRLRISATSKPSIGDYFAAASKTETADVEIDPSSPKETQAEVVREAAKAGVAFRFMVGEAGVARIELHRDKTLRVEHLQLRLGAENSISILDAKGRALVDFPKLRKGDARRWQEFQLTPVEIQQDTVTIAVELKPGQTCHGAGIYRALKAGLRIGVAKDTSMTILEADFTTGQFKVRFEKDGLGAERSIGPGSADRILGMNYRLVRDEAGGFRLETSPSE